jgi:poly(A) polymerase
MMQPIFQFHPLPDFLKCPDAQKIMAILNQSPLQALYVGGAVRQALLGFSVTDIDIATIHDPHIVINLLESHNIKTIPTGLQHGTITAHLEGKNFEITTLRRDIQGDGRHAIIEKTDDWAMDAARRDFTVNALYCDQNGQLYDPLNTDLRDIHPLKISFIGVAEQRLEEDYLRILRYCRFHAQYYIPIPNDTGWAACKMLKSGLKQLSRERITQEIFKILKTPCPTAVLQEMAHAEILPFNKDLTLFNAIIETESQDSFLISRLYALWDHSHIIHDVFHLTRAQKKIWQIFKNPAPYIHPKNLLKGLIYYLGHDLAFSVFIIQGHDLNANDARILRNWHPPKPPFNAHDIMAKTALTGKELGDCLKSMEQEWIDNDF